MENQAKRPVLVWVIAVFYGISAVLTALSFYLIYSDRIPLDSELQAFFASQSAFDQVRTFVIGATNLGAAIFLFLMRKPAAYLFPLGFGLELVATFWEVLTGDWQTAFSAGGWVGVFIGTGISIAVCVYCWRLLQRGALE